MFGAKVGIILDRGNTLKKNIDTIFTALFYKETSKGAEMTFEKALSR